MVLLDHDDIGATFSRRPSRHAPSRTCPNNKNVALK
jgi:hypothetical protein